MFKRFLLDNTETCFILYYPVINISLTNCTSDLQFIRHELFYQGLFLPSTEKTPEHLPDNK